MFHSFSERIIFFSFLYINRSFFIITFPYLFVFVHEFSKKKKKNIFIFSVHFSKEKSLNDEIIMFKSLNRRKISKYDSYFIIDFQIYIHVYVYIRSVLSSSKERTVSEFFRESKFSTSKFY